MSGKTTLIVASVLGALAVVIGAFGAHALPNWLGKQDLDEQAIAKRLDNLDVGARYHMYHALALLGIGILQQSMPQAGRMATVSFLIGILLFSGGLYFYSLTGITKLMMLVPLGGLSYILGWIGLAVSVFRRQI